MKDNNCIFVELITQNINKGKEIQDEDIRRMLGLADRNKLIVLFKEVLSGEQKKAIQMLREMIDSGLDAKNFLNDFDLVLVTSAIADWNIKVIGSSDFAGRVLLKPSADLDFQNLSSNFLEDSFILLNILYLSNIKAQE